jgi:hypothetical protein
MLLTSVYFGILDGPNCFTRIAHDPDISNFWLIDGQGACAFHLFHVTVLLTTFGLNRNSSGFVYLRFDGVAAAMKAQSSLHGRWFAGKMITATYMVKVNNSSRFHFGTFKVYSVY